MLTVLKHTPRTIQIDFPRDLVAFCRSKLISLGYCTGDIADDHKLICVYLGVCRRLVSCEPRQIFKSKDFSCAPEYSDALAKIESIIQSGGNVIPYLSRKIRKRDYNDSLLNDWGIHHLHLGTQVRSDGFIERTSSLLYCRFLEESAYFINILQHSNWECQKLLTILHENWPEMLSKFRINGIAGDQLSDEEIKELREKNVNYFLTMEDGTTYAPPGGGHMSSGSNARDVVNADYLLHWAEEGQKKLINDFPGVEARARERGFFFSDPVVFKLENKGGIFWAVEMTGSGYIHPLLSPGNNS